MFKSIPSTLLGLCVLAFLICQCKVDKTETKTDQVRIQIQQAPDHYIPFLARKKASSIVQSLLFYPLAENTPLQKETIPFLASVVPTPQNEGDKLIFTIKLRPEATWSDGKPISSKDVAFTLKLLQTPAFKTLYKGVYKPFNTYSILDEKTINIEAGECGLALDELVQFIKPLPSHYLDSTDILEPYSIKDLSEMVDVPAPLAALCGDIMDIKAQDMTTVPTSGPYRLVAESGTTIKLTKVKDYWGEKLNVEQLKAYPSAIDFSVLSEANSIEAILRAGELDMAVDMDISKIERLKEDQAFGADYTIMPTQTPILYYFPFNIEKKPLNDDKVRQALVMSMDLNTFIEKVLKGAGQRIHSSFHPSNYFYNDSIKPYTFDIAKATTLLEEAGWTDSDADGFVDKNGTDLEVDILLSNKSVDGKTMAEVWQDNAKKIGVKLNLVFKTREYVQEALKTRNFEITTTGLVGQIKYADLTDRWGTGGKRNFSNFSNPEVDALLQKIRLGCLSESEYATAYDRIQTVIHETCPALFLFTKNDYIISSKQFNSPKVSFSPPYIFPQYLKSK